MALHKSDTEALRGRKSPTILIFNQVRVHMIDMCPPARLRVAFDQHVCQPGHYRRCCICPPKPQHLQRPLQVKAKCLDRCLLPTPVRWFVGWGGFCWGDLPRSLTLAGSSVLP
eukprot:GHVT01050820.1.p1 GENE.GHVT01050820.1~~GHVT01050820.1.p1  ORF type:complete len:113 (-),score=2.83 GHVT01050820.1:225-563(-)